MDMIIWYSLVIFIRHRKMENLYKYLTILINRKQAAYSLSKWYLTKQSSLGISWKLSEITGNLLIMVVYYTVKPQKFEFWIFLFLIDLLAYSK